MENDTTRLFEDENYTFPENGVPRLIGRSTYKNVTLYSFECDYTNLLGSVDGIVIDGKFKSPEHGIRCKDMICTCQTEDDKPPVEFTSAKANGWRFFYDVKIAHSALRVCIGLNAANSKVDMTRYRVEYNPNKVGNSPLLNMALAKVARYAKTAELKRYDIAADMLVPRDKCRLIKDRRNYEYYHGKTSRTEYLGTRSHPGRVKLYDKTAELRDEQGIEIGEDWTRLELTCSGDWDVSEIMHQMPKFIMWKNLEDSDVGKNLRALAVACMDLIKAGLPVDHVISELEYRSRAKLLDMLHAPELDIPLDLANDVKGYALLELANFRSMMQG